MTTDLGKQITEGRHVGLDFYDLLIRELKTPLTESMSAHRDFAAARTYTIRVLLLLRHKARRIGGCHGPKSGRLTEPATLLSFGAVAGSSLGKKRTSYGDQYSRY